MQNQKNLMHINSTHIGNMESLADYQRLFINDKIGMPSSEVCLKAIRNKYINCKIDNIENIWMILEEKYNFYSASTYNASILDENFIANINWQYESSYIGLAIRMASSSIKKCNTYIKEIEDALSEFIINGACVSYNILQSQNGDTLSETFYQETLDVNFNPVATPFIDDVDTYIENYLNSKTPVLILQGEPGTGKTTLVKYILKAMQERVLKKRDMFNAIYSFDEGVFYVSDFYKRIIYDEYDVLVLEDMNQVLHKNQNEESLNPLNKFLSVTDGLISKYKKIIITTNIDSKHQLNTALIRPGRCYDVIPFRKLEGIEIDNLCDSCAKDLNLQTESINLSEFYARCNGEMNSKMFSSRVGF